MKICHISTGVSLSLQTGITNYVRSLADYQHKSGHEVWVLSGPDDNEYDYKVQQYKSEKIVPMKWRALKDESGLAEIKKFLEREKFDIIHIHMMLDIDWNFHEILKPYKYVVSLHDYFFLCPRMFMIMHNNALCTCYEEKKCSKCISLFNTIRLFNAIEYKISHQTKLINFRWPEVPQSMTKERFKRFQILLENAEMLLPVSSRAQEIYENSGIHGNYKVLHIGNITADIFKEDFEFDWSKEKIDIAMLGALSYLKGGDLLVKLANALNSDNISIHFYGKSGTYTKKLEVAGIINHGPYKQNELPEILKNTDIGLVLSVCEDNGPQVVMEFLNNHIPVVGTKMGGIPDFVNESNGILFDPYSQKDFELLVKKLSNIDRNDVYHLKSSIKRTKTTKEHSADIDEVYCQILNQNK